MYVFWFHFAVNVILLVIAVLKLNALPFNCHSTNVCPSFVGFVGLVAFAPLFTVCELTDEPPFELNVTVYFWTAFCSHFAVSVILFVITVLKSNSLPFNCHSTNV